MGPEGGAILSDRVVMMKTRRPFLIFVGALLGIAIVFGTTGTLQIGAGIPSLDLATVPVTSIPHWTVREGPQLPGIPPRPQMRCESAIVIDNSTGEVLYTKDAHARRPIASLTKLLTSLVFLECGPDMTETATVSEEDAANSSRSSLRVGEELTLRDFLYAALVCSDNRAARVLARSAGVEPDSFIVLMNKKARALGMDSTLVVEPTGLSEQNVSTAFECAILLEVALQNHLIRKVTTSNEVIIKPLNKKRQHRLVNTNRLLRHGFSFRGSKTGYINESGWCIAATGLSADGHDVTVVVLGAPSNSHRFQALRNALLWAFKFPLHPIVKS